MPNSLLRFALVSKALLFTVVIHGALLALLLYSFNWVDDIERGGVEVIQAVAVSEDDIRAQVEKDQAAEQARQQEQRQAAAELEELERKQAQAKKELAELEARKQREQRQREQAAAEEKRKEEERKQREAERKKQLEAERKRKAEAEAERQRQAEEAARKKAEAEKKRRAEEARKKAEAEEKRKADLQKKLAAEEAERKRAEARRRAEQAREKAEAQRARTQAEAAGALGALKDQIARAVESVWRRPAGSASGLTALIRVRVAPDGEVTFARVAQGSGDRLFDESAVVAVKRASPLPFPAEPKYYVFIKEFNFRFAPGDR